MDFNYSVTNIGEIDSPALLIYPQLIEDNLDKAIALCNHSADKLRPHVKTHKMLEVAAMCINKNILKFKCATIAEAEMLAIAGAEDVLLAYQPSAVKAKRFHELSSRYARTRFSCLVDNTMSLSQLAEIFGTETVNVFIDLNIGMNRTGIKPEGAIELYNASLSYANVRVRGLHCYDGNIYDTDLNRRKERVNEVYDTIIGLKSKLDEDHQTQLSAVLGGSPTFHLYAELDNTVEVSPGTFVFWDADYKRLLPDLDFNNAAILLTRVVSVIDENHICIDAGHKSVASENPFPRMTFLTEDSIKQVGHSEEHMVLEVADAKKYAPGDLLYAIPNHICPTVALYNNVYVVNDNTYSECWNVVARDREISV